MQNKICKPSYPFKLQAFSSLTKKTKMAFHSRSNSFPSRPHPIVSHIDEHVTRLRASEANSTSSSVSHKLNGLQDLHDCVDKLLQQPLTQQALAQLKNRKWVDDLLDGSLQVLDLCSSAKDFVLQAKESTHELQSVLRRRRRGEPELASKLRKYLSSRKSVRKAINEALEKSNNRGTKCNSTPSDDHETEALVSKLRQVEAVTVSVFESLLCLVSGPKSRSKISSWALVSKLMHPKRIANEGEGKNMNEFESVDATVKSLAGKPEDNKQIEMQNQLKDLELCIQDLGEGLDRLSRHLIKTRVSLLNILNH